MVKEKGVICYINLLSFKQDNNPEKTKHAILEFFEPESAHKAVLYNTRASIFQVPITVTWY
jgi:hypothetical protein